MTNLKIEANPILGKEETRIVLEEGQKRVSFNLNNYTYNQIALRLIKAGNIEVAKNLILDNGGEYHIEETIDISRL